jgi:hypothetical protein
MANRSDLLNLELAHYENFKKYIPEYSNLCEKSLEYLVSIGGLKISTLFEHAVANVSGLDVVDLDHADWSDNSEGKLSSVRLRSYGKVYSAPISNIKNKRGLIRSQVYERKTKQFYYFTIPYHAYENLKSKTSIELPFDLSGLPKKRSKWWQYEQDTFEKMCLLPNNFYN